MSEHVDTDRNLLFGILALQHGIVDSTQFTEACAACSSAAQKTLAEIFVERGWMTPDESREVEQLVKQKIASQACDADKSRILQAIGEMPPPSNSAARPNAGVGNSAKPRGFALLQGPDSPMTSASPTSGYEQMQTIHEEPPDASHEVEAKIEGQLDAGHASLMSEATVNLLPESDTTGHLEPVIDSDTASRGFANLGETRSSAPRGSVPSGSVPSGSVPSGYGHMETIAYTSPDERSRYSLTKLHGEGGIGRVWQALDQRLNRQVALKEIRPDKEISAMAAKRFTKEAQITSQLEHPNIVPVYELSGAADSSHCFYTMRLVRGDTFRDAIDAYHRHRREGRATTLELRELLNSFIAICNALGFAHSRGILHRDLKPSNVMVGSFGEVVVLDWGLAKMIDQPDDDDENLLEGGPVSITDELATDATMQGAVLGTLPYMAPEQAAGRIDKMDARTDIYGLGAILYCILTGNHPHRGTSTREVRAQILNEPTPRVRADNAKVHPGLDAICAKAMAKKRSERYAKARDLAEDVRRWLADEPVDCYKEPMITRAGRWLRRHRTWAQSIAAALLIVTAVSVASVIVVDGARRAKIVALQAESAAKQRAEESFLKEQEAKQKEREAVDAMMTGVNDVLAYFPGMQELREKLLQQAVKRYEQFTVEQSDDPSLQVEAARAMIRLGDVFRGLSKYDRAESAYEEAARRMRSLLDTDSTSKDARLQLATAKAKLGVLHADLGESEQSEQSYDESLRRYDELLQGEGDPLVEHQRAGAVVNRAMLHNKRGNNKEALGELQKAAEVFEKLATGKDDPAFVAGLAMTEANIANVLVSMGRNGEGILYAEEAVSLYSTLADKFEYHLQYLESLATARLNLAAAYRRSGRARDELSTYEAALADYSLLVDSRADVPVYRERQADTEREIAAYLHQLGENKVANEFIASAIETTEALLKTQSQLPQFHEQWALEQATLGRILSDLGHEDEAAIRLGDAIDRFGALIDADPGYSAIYQAQRAACQNELGMLQQKAGDDEALATLKQAAAEFEELLKGDQDNAGYQDGLARVYSDLADLHWQMEQAEPARDYYQKAILLRRALDNEPEHGNSLARLIVACQDPELATGDEAIAAAKKATNEARENARFATTLGSCYTRFGQYDEAIDTLRGVDDLSPQGGTTHEFWLAYALAKRNAEGDMNEARNRYEQAITRMELNAPGRIELLHLRELVQSLVAEPEQPSEGAAQ